MGEREGESSVGNCRLHFVSHRELLSETAKAPGASYSIPQRYVFRFLFGGLANKSQDVIRMLKMVHGSNDEKNLLPMVRYAQCSGNDAVCKAIILKHLGEPDCPDVRTVVRENEGTTTVSRDIGVHARTLVQLLDVRTQEGRDMTLNMLVKDWRSTSSSAPQWYVTVPLLGKAIAHASSVDTACGTIRPQKPVCQWKTASA